MPNHLCAKNTPSSHAATPISSARHHRQNLARSRPYSPLNPTRSPPHQPNPHPGPTRRGLPHQPEPVSRPNPTGSLPTNRNPYPDPTRPGQSPPTEPAPRTSATGSLPTNRTRTPDPRDRLSPHQPNPHPGPTRPGLSPPIEPAPRTHTAGSLPTNRTRSPAQRGRVDARPNAEPPSLALARPERARHNPTHSNLSSSVNSRSMLRCSTSMRLV